MTAAHATRGDGADFGGEAGKRWIAAGEGDVDVAAASEVEPGSREVGHEGPGRAVLVCTLGLSWAVIPEVYGFLAPERLDLYRHHPRAAALRAERDRRRLLAPDAIFVATTQSPKVDRGIEALREWAALLAGRAAPRTAHARVHIWRADGTGELANSAECARMRELILRVVLHAHEFAGRGGQVTLSLAGGRKTMSADLQRAGSLFGCAALLHVVDSGSLPDPLRSPTPALLTQPLPAVDAPTQAPLAGAIEPLVIGSATRAELVEVETAANSQDKCAIRGASYPLPAANGETPERFHAEVPSLTRELERREREGSALFGSYLASLTRGERHETWRSLYRLSPRRIDELRRTRLCERHRPLLLELPKADLHCHIGGILDLDDQRAVGQAIWAASTAREQEAALSLVGPWLASERWPFDWPARLRGQEALEPMDAARCRATQAAALLAHARPGVLEQHLWGDTEPRFALKDRCNFEAYEQPGELTGSAVLSHPAALEPYVAGIVSRARRDGIRYLELRGSPTKYDPTDGLGWLRRLRDAIRRSVALDARHVDEAGVHPRAGAAAATGGARRAIEIRFVVIADRRHAGGAGEAVERVVDLAVKAKRELPDFVVGVDIAGDEGAAEPSLLAPHFERAFEACLPITVHAGEGEPAERIWQAAYRLHADRVGHGLTLWQNQDLCERFRDRGICVEMCPTSNLEVVGFRDPARSDPDASERLDYPLMRLWSRGVPVAVCTDNPGISRTTLADELLVASRLTPPDRFGDGVLTLWDALAIVKQGFTRAFLTAREREEILKQVDAEVYRLCADLPVD